MKRPRFQCGHWLALLAVLCLAASPALAQRGLGQGHRKGRHGEMARGPEGRPRGSKGPADARRMLGLPPRWMERMQEMSPEEQERFLANNERFKSLPPERQAQIHERLRQWNSLTPEQRQALRERARVWEQMPPEQRRQVRNEIFPKWQQLPPQRRQVLLQHLRQLHGLSDSERDARLNDPAFTHDLSPEEQGLLRQLSSLKVGSSAGVP